MNDSKTKLIIIAAIVLIAGIIALVAYKPEQPKSNETPIVSKQTESRFPAPKLEVDHTLGKADYNWEFKTADGKTDLLSNYKGKVIFISLWATWCGPCLAEMPSVQNLYNDMKDEVVFLVISNEDLPTVSGFANNGKYTLPFISAEGEVPPSFATDIIPTTFIVDKTGNVVVKHLGASNWGDESVKAFLKSL